MPDSIRSAPVRPLLVNKPVDSVKIGVSSDSGKPDNRKNSETPEPSGNSAKSKRSKKPKKTGKVQLGKPEDPPKPEGLAKSSEERLKVSQEQQPPKLVKESTTPSKEKSRKQTERTKAWRRLERSKKKGKRQEIKDKADIEESSTINTRMPSGASRSPSSMDVGLESNTGKKNDSAPYSPNTKKHKTAHKPFSNPDIIKCARGNNNFVAETTPSAKLLMSDNSATSTKKEPASQLFWSCSLCSSVWKQEKAWAGHLMSGQHMRRALKTVQQMAPEIAPFDRLDILSANDPFGWGTGSGVVEEEDSEDDEAIMEEDRQTNRVGEGTPENDDDDMDFEE
ncbi:hypothetical protein BG000_002871 [Podila horticola]|nr:hypothetical protein BG000_002871 [Podila horticola]